MERQSDKHAPRVDDSMKRQVNADAVIVTEDRGTGSLTRQEVELRQDLARFLERKIFPATRDDIVKDAAEMGAPDHVIAWFKRLPERSYEGFPQIWEVGSGHAEPRKL
jgi:hypothetical protein